MALLTYTRATPPNIRAAIACVQIRADVESALDAFVRANRIESVQGRPALRSLFGIDEGLVIRWDGLTLDLFPHAGPAILRQLSAKLESLGVRTDEAYRYPEAADDIEQRMLQTLARAASPLAVDLLLAQPERWRSHHAEERLADAAVLSRLITPPLVVAVGAPNIGKSTLLNTLAGRSVSIVADEPGTTRDHVGATLDLGGLVVRYLDAPGRLQGAQGIDREAIERADEAARGADLVVLCGDPGEPPPPPEGHGSVLRVCLRADMLALRAASDSGLGWEADAIVCAQDGTGIPAFVSAIRERLVPQAVLDDLAPWQFWG